MKKIISMSFLVITIFLYSCNISEKTDINNQVTGNTNTQVSNTIDNNAATEGNTNSLDNLEDASIQQPKFKVYTLQELESDFDYVVDLLNEHNTFTFSDINQFEQTAIEEREKLFEGMSILEFYQSLCRLVSAVRCGHSGVYLPSFTESQIKNEVMFIPFDVYLYQNDLYITKDFGDTTIPLGSKIVSINGVNTEAIIEKLYAHLMADGTNLTLKNSYINSNFYSLYFKFIDQSQVYDISYEDIEDKSIKKQKVDGRSYYSIRNNMTEVTDGEGVAYEVNDDYGLLTIRTFNTVGGYTLDYYEQNYKQFFSEVYDKNCDNIIIDMRHAHGGHPNAAAMLLQYILNNDEIRYFRNDMPPFYPDLMESLEPVEPHFDGEIFILEDGDCFSTTGHLLALMKYHKIGTIIGEESGGGYAVTDGSFYEDLPNTKIRIWTSSVPWIVDTEGLLFGRGIEPDLPFTPSVKDVIDGYDSMLEYAVQLINNND